MITHRTERAEKAVICLFGFIYILFLALAVARLGGLI